MTPSNPICRRSGAPFMSRPQASVLSFLPGDEPIYDKRCLLSSDRFLPPSGDRHTPILVRFCSWVSIISR